MAIAEDRERSASGGVGHRPSPAQRPAARSRWPQNVLEYGLVLALCALLAVLMTQPLAAQRESHLIRSRDTMVHYWNGWWAQEALTKGLPLFHTRHIFYPEGVSLVYHNVGWLNVVAWLGLQTLMGGLAAYNTTLLLYVALCGFAAYLLTRYLTRRPMPAILAALVYQNWPARLTRLNFPNLVNTVGIPLSLLFLIRTLREERWIDAVLAGVFVALTGYARWQQLIPAAIVIALYLATSAVRWIWQAARDRRCTLASLWKAHRRRVLLTLLAGAVATAALLPPFLMLVEEQLSSPADLMKTDNEAAKGTDLFAYVTPGDRHPMVGRWTERLYHRYYQGQWSLVAYVGLIPLALALLGVLKGARGVLPWAAAALCLLLLGLGPVLSVRGTVYPRAPSLYSLVDRVVPLSLIRVPARFNVFLALPIAVLTAYGAMHLLEWARGRARWVPILVTLVLGVGVLMEYFPGPTPMQRPTPSPYHDELAAEPSDFAVLNVPITAQSAKAYMLAQTWHEHPMMQGHVSRLPPGAYSTIRSNPWLNELSQTSEMSPRFTDVSRQLRSLAEHNVTIMMLQKTEVAPDRIAHWKRYLLTTPVHEDDVLAAYRTEPQAGRDFTLTEEPAPGLGPIRVITSTDCVNPGGVLEVDVGWGTSAPPRQDYGVELALALREGMAAAERTYPLSPGWPTGDWPAHAVAWGYYTLPISSTLPGGAYSVNLTLTDQATGSSEGTAMELGTVEVAEEPCTFPTPPGAVPTNALYGDDLRLLGYDIERGGDHLLVRLHWRSEQRMETDYKVFVHVFDPETKQPVAQDDSAPHRGAYPTVFWGPGESVKDHIPISLAGAPPGSYGVAVGVYDPTTMDRLPLVTRDGPRADGRFELPGETVVIKGSDP